jgi:hypothetical protein
MRNLGASHIQSKNVCHKTCPINSNLSSTFLLVLESVLQPETNQTCNLARKLRALKWQHIQNQHCLLMDELKKYELL